MSQAQKKPLIPKTVKTYFLIPFLCLVAFIAALILFAGNTAVVAPILYILR